MRVSSLLRGAMFAVITAAAAVSPALVPSVAHAADSAKSPVTTLIQRAAELFDDQAYEESMQTLSAALLRPGASTKEKIEIYRLLAYNFITLKRTDEADAAVRGLLVQDENFSLPSTESPRFRDFFEATKKKWVEEGKPGKAATTDGGSTPAEEQIKITHSSPAEVPPGTQIKLTGTIDDTKSRVRGVQLYYRAGSKGKFIIVAGTYTLGKFTAQIPAKEVKSPLVEYYLEAVDNGGLPVAARGDAAAPLRIVVPEPPKSSIFTSPAFWVPVGAVVVTAAVGIPLLYTFVLQPSSGPGTAHVKVGVK